MRIVIDSDKNLFRAITYLKNLNKDKKWTMEVKEYRKDRSGAQNRLYWSWIKIIGDELGYDKEDMHATLAVKFLDTKMVELHGGQVTVARSSTTLNTKEFTEYLNSIEIFVSTELGIQLPHPEDIYCEAMGRVR